MTELQVRLIRLAVTVLSALATLGVLTWAVHTYNEHFREQGRAEVRDAWNKAVIDGTAILAAEKAARDKKQLENDHETAQAIDRARADAAGARLASDSLRAQLARFVAAGRAASSNLTPASDSAPAGDPIGVLADVLSRADERAGVLAQAADASRAAGDSCVRAYEAVSGVANE